MKNQKGHITDIELGMKRSISRRDILHGFGALSATALSTSFLSACSSVLAKKPVTTLDDTPMSKITSVDHLYPPAKTGLRGNHKGSFEVAHQLGRENKQNWGSVSESDSTLYDLVIVGAGISGLSAAHFHLKKFPEAKILIIDNHDDFGGHAKRNEFKVGEHTLLGYGGAQTLQEPSSYSAVVKELLDDINVKTKRFEKAYDGHFYIRNNLAAGVHFNKDKWGVDKIVPISLGMFPSYLPLAPSVLSVEQAVAQMPISNAAKVDFVKLLTLKDDQIPHIPSAEKEDFLKNISYKEFLSTYLNITQEHVFDVLQDLTVDYGVGIDAANAYSAMSYANLPGWAATGLPNEESEGEAYIHHFPDGNASIARLIVRKMIPEVAPGNTMEDVVTAKFDYSKLDQNTARVRLRLNSTATHVKNINETGSAKKVSVSYVVNGQACRVYAKSCVLACNNSIIPHLCPEMPKAQRDALSFQEKTPILYTTVALRNWQAWKELNIGAVVSPGSYHINTMIDFPVSIGSYEFSQSPDTPIIVHMEKFPHTNNAGKTSREQHRLGRHELIATSFETIERNVRLQLSSMLGEYGFDPATDIIDITVNRWAHGYAYWYKPLFDTTYEDRDDARYPHMIARKPFGKITIANADSGAKAMFESAVEQGHRAINELL